MLAAPPPSLRSRLFAAAFVLTALAIIWFSLKPMAPQPAGSQIDKVEHFTAYASLTLLGFLSRGGASARLVAAILLFGCGVEVAQMLLPTGRTGSVLDALANTAGASLVWAAWVGAAGARRSPRR